MNRDELGCCKDVNPGRALMFLPKVETQSAAADVATNQNWQSEHCRSPLPETTVFASADIIMNLSGFMK
jgi:hypothetical protein